ncbi:MAG TPA: LCP family protein [Candidatus Saccharimonadales bacterium]|nr:LCP family protein [Candidatus Saccharimonadales bacterium]
MAQNRHSLDGFVPRRPGSADRPNRRIGEHSDEIPSRFTKVDAQTPKPGVINRGELGIARRDIDSSLKGIDVDEPQKGKGSKKGRKKAPLSKKKRIIKWSAIALGAIILALAGFMLYKIITTGSNIFKGGILDIIQSQPLKEDANGRSNILILGTSEDDPGHGGAYLTDSMMVMSIDQHKKIVDMFSIPRDLYVEYGRACNSGYQGKINEYFNCVNPDWKSKSAEDERLTQTRKFVGEIFGLDIQYGVHVNNTVIKQAVDAVGGVDIDIQGDGPVPYGVEPGSILDRNFDWRCNYECFLVKYSPGVHHIDGLHALFLAQARGDSAPTYGLARSNFDREINQQKIIVALKEKAASSGTFTNPVKVTGLLDALGDNLRTNFETKEIRTLMKLGSDIDSKNINRLNLSDGDKAVVEAGQEGGASVVVPTAGTFNYTEIRAFIQKALSSNDVTREGANVAVLNGSGKSGVAQAQADKLTAAGFTVSTVDTAPDGTYADVEVYQIGKGMAKTKAKLESMFKIKVKAATPPVTVADGTNFVIIFGKDPSSSN